MKNVLHIYCMSGKTNCGDFLIGPATKYEFSKKIGEEIKWSNLELRKKFTEDDLNFINTFDYVVIGAGGVILPDTNPNKISCWQFAFPTNWINLIKPKIFIISIGYNIFYGQKMTMPHKGNGMEDHTRDKIFKNNIEKWIEKSDYFSMRHNGDIKNFIKLIDDKYKDKINFEFCPVFTYLREKYKDMDHSGIYHCFEIKQDREWRRYRGTSKIEFYKNLLSYIKFLISKGEKISVMKHTKGQGDFEKYLTTNNVKFKSLDNTCYDETKIINNFKQVKKIYCTAGHSQMISEALGIDHFSLIGHPKLEFFLKDINKFDKKYYSYNKDKNLLENLKESYFLKNGETNE